MNNFVLFGAVIVTAIIFCFLYMYSYCEHPWKTFRAGSMNWGCTFGMGHIVYLFGLVECILLIYIGFKFPNLLDAPVEK